MNYNHLNENFILLIANNIKKGKMKKLRECDNNFKRSLWVQIEFYANDVDDRDTGISSSKTFF